MSLTIKPILREIKILLKNDKILADNYKTVSQLLYSDENSSKADHIIVNMLPTQLKGKVNDDLERAAASVLERVVLGALIKKQKPKKVFEIGTFRGFTCLAMAENAPENAEIYTLDLPPELSAKNIAEKYYKKSTSSGFHQMDKADIDRSVGILISLYKGKNKISQLYDDSSKMNFSAFKGEIDFFFVDGCHAYDMAKKDTLTAWSCLSKGGMIVWHDYTWKSVRKAIKDAKLNTSITYVKETSLAFAIKS
ncbi:Methyltransferase domain-containing protein [Marivirga sericea]|uniref:Methyltransferase domain-containing protein n=1 Tax=Marivirga sericea TaxID=1028 RepID=A0A1X7KM03_9BACT|nr:class I SAM-dependent methyltransferase [Marivirga sericea]SMG41756.1 Methyltransferase domain-containing protein [Marivirga sericea]